jgi:hypothetical protein
MNGATPIIRNLTEAASQSFKAGHPVILTSNKVTIATTAGALVDIAQSGALFNSTNYDNANVTATTVVGIALDDATGVTDAPCRVLICTEDVELLANIVHKTVANGVTATTQIGQTLGLMLGTFTTTTADAAGETYTAKRTLAAALDTTGDFVITEVPKSGVLFGQVWGKIVSGSRGPLAS